MSAVFDMVNSDTYRLACEIGATFKREFVFRDPTTRALLPIEGYTSAQMQVRPAPGVDTVLDIAAELDAQNSRVICTADAETTADAVAGMYLYDLLLVGPAATDRVVMGRFEVVEQITEVA